jgi:dephospho-CoA kinase
MFLVGLTGGIAAGKSTISDMLKDLGAEVIDADLIAREVVEPGTLGLEQVVAAFGDSILQPDGTLSRSALAQLVFGDIAKRTRLESILHPLIKEQTKKRIATSTSSIVIYVVPLLVEANLDYPFDFIVTVESGVDTQVQRLRETRGLTEEQALSRIRAQASEAERVARANLRLDGTLPLARLEEEVAKLWGLLVLKAKAKAADGKN